MREEDHSLWDLREGTGPVVASAIHDGHHVSPLIRPWLAISEAERLREEDPHSGAWAKLVDTFVVANHSRFEVDLNRPREEAVYITPEDSWGLKVWKESPGKELIEHSLRQYDAFYRRMEALFTTLAERWGRFVVLDLHSYNHRRSGPDGPPADFRGQPGRQHRNRYHGAATMGAARGPLHC